MKKEIPEVIAHDDDGVIWVKGKIDMKTAELVADDYGLEGGVERIEYVHMRVGRNFVENYPMISHAKKGEKGAFLCTEITPK